MEQNLLAERFKLAVHFAKKEMQIYEMTVGKDGQKFKGATVYDRPLPPHGADQRTGLLLLQAPHS